MKRSTTKILIENYESICNDLIAKFVIKQDLEFDGWISDEVGSIACFAGQYFFNFSEILHDLKTKQPKGLILAWLNDGVDYNLNRIKHEYINYKSYTIGLRYSDLEN